MRKHNRQIHKANILKGSKKKLNQAPYLVSGYFDLRKLEGTIIHRSASYKRLTLISRIKTFLFERRKWHIHLQPIEDGVSCA